MMYSTLRFATHRTTLRALSTTSTSSISMNKIGFVGLGNMGLPMMKNLAQNPNNEIMAFDVNPQSRQLAESHVSNDNVQIVDDMTPLVRNQHVIITMLPGDAIVDRLYAKLNQDWLHLSKQLPNRRIVIDCSTVSPMTSQKWSKVFQESGTATLFDAPVSGGVQGSINGTLTFMLGGCAMLHQQLENDSVGHNDITPLLQQMGSRVLECGPHVGAGAACKLANNLALATQMIGVCEALNLGESLGVDPAVLTKVMESSTANCWSLNVNHPHPDVASTKEIPPPASRGYQGGFATNLMLKDLGLAVEVAQSHNVAVPLTSASQQLYQLSAAQGRGNQDFASLFQFLKGAPAPIDDTED